MKEIIAKSRAKKSKYLSLDINRTESIPSELYELTWLEYLELDLLESPISLFPEEISKLTKLKEIQISGGNFGSLPESFCGLTSLEKIEIECSILFELPENIGNLKNLTHMSFYGTEIDVLPESIGKLQSLKVIDFSSCRLISLPASMGNLSNLEEIQLSKNRLTVIPEEFSNLKQLKKLYLAGNRLSEVPICIKKLKSLTIAVLSDNKITEIPSWLDKNICALSEEDINPRPLTSMENSHYREGLKLYKSLCVIFPVLNENQEKHPDLDQKALQIYDMAVLNQKTFSRRQRNLVEAFLNYYFMPENEEISHVVEKYSIIDRRLLKKEGTTLLQKLLFEKPINITADEKETIVFFWERSGYETGSRNGYGYWKHINQKLLSAYCSNYRTNDVARYSYWNPINHAILCFDLTRTFSVQRHITRCPVCASDITITERSIPTSTGAEFKEKASIPNVETNLHICPLCRWWAVSELIQECEANGMGEAVFTCGLRTDETNSQENIYRNILKMYNGTSHPWSPVFLEQQYWDKAKSMTMEEAIWLFGEDEVKNY